MSEGHVHVTERPLAEGDLFVGRFTELLEAAQLVKRGRPLVLVFGTPRVGVTSFLNHLETELASNLAVRRCTANVWTEPLRETLAALAAVVADPADHAAQAATVGPSDTHALKSEADSGGECVFLERVPARLLLGDQGQVWVAGVLSYLESHAGLQLVVAVQGARPVSGSLLSPVLTSLPAVELKGLSLEQTEELLVKAANNRLRYEFDAMRRVWQLTSGNPYFVQVFGAALIEVHRMGGRVTANAVERSVPVVLERGAAALESIWSDCSIAAQAVLSVVSELPGRHGTFTRNDLVGASQPQAANLREQVADSALVELEASGTLEKMGRGGYRHTLEIFRLWVSKYRPLKQLLGRGKVYRKVLAARGSGARATTWRGVFGWAGVVAALVFVLLLWNSRDAGRTLVVGALPTATQPQVATRPPVIPGTAPGWIAYMSKPNPDADWDIWLMRGDGSDPKRLTEDVANDQTPCWSADGQAIAFVSDRDGNKEIYTVKVDGTQSLNLTHHPAEDWTPAWSPDGRFIAFSSYRDGNWELYVMDANGANPQRLTRNNAADYAPSWSPDGQRIAFQSNGDGNWEIYVIERDGTGLQRLTDDEATDSAPAWSPDGQLIAFESYRDGNMEIYIMATDGTGVGNLTEDEYSNEHGPAWARAGSRLLYYTNRDGGWDIFSIKVDGTEKDNLTLNPALEQRPVWHE